jgi:hypothetical protein
MQYLLLAVDVLSILGDRDFAFVLTNNAEVV